MEWNSMLTNDKRFSLFRQVSYSFLACGDWNAVLFGTRRNLFLNWFFCSGWTNCRETLQRSLPLITSLGRWDSLQIGLVAGAMLTSQESVSPHFPKWTKAKSTLLLKPGKRHCGKTHPPITLRRLFTGVMEVGSSWAPNPLSGGSGEHAVQLS